MPERRHIAAALDRMETALSNRDVQAALKQRVDMINTQLDRYGKIRKIAVISDHFPEELRSPTALQKVKIDRHAVEDRYRAEIETIYSGGSQESEASSMEFS